MMDQAWRRLTFSNCLFQSGPGEPRRQRSLQRPAHHLTRETIEDDGQVNELCFQPNIRESRPIRGNELLLRTMVDSPAGDIIVPDLFRRLPLEITSFRTNALTTTRLSLPLLH